MSWVFCVSGFVRWRVDLGALQDVDSYGELRVQWMEGSSCLGKGNEGKQHIKHGRNLPQSVVVRPHMFGVAMIVNHENFVVFSPLFAIFKKYMFIICIFFWGENWSFMTHLWWGPNDFWQVESMKDPWLSRRDWWRTPENPKESGQICQHSCDSQINFQQKNYAFLSTFIRFYQLLGQNHWGYVTDWGDEVYF